LDMEITEKQKHKISEIAEKYGLRLILLFGSRVSGDIHKESDFDVAYLAEKQLDFEEENRLNYEFTNVFQNDKVDTVDLKKANPLLMFGIFQDAQVLFAGDAYVFPRYRTYAFKKYVEAKPLYKLKFGHI